MPVDFKNMDDILKYQLVSCIVLLLGIAVWFPEVYSTLSHVISNIPSILFGIWQVVRIVLGSFAMMAPFAILLFGFIGWNDNRSRKNMGLPPRGKKNR